MSDKKNKVLLVEDDEMLAEMYHTKFDHDGFDVLMAYDGVSALEKAKEKDIEIILLDVILPKLDGFSVLEQLKKEKETKNIPVIMLTNLGQDDDIEKAKKLGAVDYLVKANLTPQQVVDKVCEVLKK